MSTGNRTEMRRGTERMTASFSAFLQFGGQMVLVAAFLSSAALAQPGKTEGGVEPFQTIPASGFKPGNHTAKEAAAVEFTGVKSFQEIELHSAISEQLKGLAQSGPTPAMADDTAFFLALFYRKNGFPDVNVQWNITAEHKLALTVSEGRQTVISQIHFSGNRNISDAILQDYIVGATRERQQKKRKQLPYVESDIETGIERILALYKDNGFLDAVVEPAIVTFSGDKSCANLSVTIREGVQYHFGKIGIDSDLMFLNLQSKAADNELQIKLKTFTQKPYTPNTVTNIQREIVYYYRQHGYYDVKVEASSNPETAINGIVPADFKVVTGNVYHFGSIHETGLDHLNPGFLKKRFARLEGEIYNPVKLDETYVALMRTGLFKILRITPNPSASNEIDLDMDAVEAKSKDLGFLAGYDNLEGFLGGIQATERNLFGTGRSVSGSMEFAQRLLKGEVQYLDPWLLDSDYSLRLKLNALTQDFKGYSKIETGGRIELGRTISKNYSASIFLLPRNVRLNTISITPYSDVGPATYFVDSLGASLTVDERNSATNPDKGFIFTTTMDYAGSPLGSGIDFIRGTGRFSYYIPVTKSSVLALGARGGVICPLKESSSIPIDERFFNGGGRSVRSFSELELGPKDASGHPIGGDTFTTFNAEYDFPLFGDLGGAAFADAGSVGSKLSDGAGLMRYGIGAGLRYRLPIGPVRLDYGVNPSPRAGEDKGAFNFSFGFAF